MNDTHATPAMLEAELSQLVEWLDSDANVSGLDSVSAHGFLVATVVGPELSDWQDIFFDSQGAPKHIRSALHTWRAQLLSELTAHESVELPCELDTEVESELGDWCLGFVDALFANEQADWFEIEEVNDLTLPMIAFSGIEEDDPELMAIRQDQALMQQMAQSIEKNLAELFLIFHGGDDA